MSCDPFINTLPLLTLGLPGYVSGWLLDAGVSIAPLDPTGVRRGIAPRHEGRSIVLFDSRSASARIDAEAAEALGYVTIDAARLLTSRQHEEESERTVLQGTDPRRRFIEALRPAVEAAGGLWIRLADFPHPYRWAVCENEQSDHDASTGRLETGFATIFSAFADLSDMVQRPGRLAVGDWLKACAKAGRPIRTERSANAILRRHGAGPVDSALTWRATLDEFAAWWQFRRQIGIHSLRRQRSLEIEFSIPHGVTPIATPALEIWRGRHVAVVPLKASGRIVIQDDTLPFQFNAARHPAGFTADAAEADFIESLERSAVVAAV